MFAKLFFKPHYHIQCECLTNEPIKVDSFNQSSKRRILLLSFAQSENKRAASLALVATFTANMALISICVSSKYLLFNVKVERTNIRKRKRFFFLTFQNVSSEY